MQLKKVSLLESIMQEATERIDHEMEKVMANILDVNTKAESKRSITLTIDMKPGGNRDTVSISMNAKSKLAILEPVAKTLVIAPDAKTGEIVLAEWKNEVPGQMDVEGHEEEMPKIMKLAQQG